MALIVAGFQALLGYLGVYGAAATVISYTLTAATLYSAMAYQQAQAKKAARALASSLDQGRSVMSRDPIAPRRLIYGQIPVSGPLAFMGTSGTSNEYLHLVIMLAGHECQELGTVYFDGVEVPLDGGGDATGTFAGYAHIDKHLGTASQAADAGLIAAFPGSWTSAHQLKGIAYLHARLKYSSTIFPNGIPTITCMVKGAKVYDPRAGGQSSSDPSTWAWSANAALCLAHYFNDSKFGKGIPWSRINTTALSEAAGICDETVVLADDSTEARYTCNGTVTSDQDPDTVIPELSDAMAGCVVDTGGVWSIHAGAYRTSTLTLTDDDLVGAIQVQVRQSRRDTYNGVKGTYIAPINQWQPADFPVIKNDTYQAQDGGIRLWKDVTYNFTTSYATAQRLAKIDVERGRQQIVVTGEWSLKAMQAMPGDVVCITRAVLGWTAKEFEVVEWTRTEKSDKNGPVLSVSMTLRETASGVWDWNNGEETTVDLAPNSSLISSYPVQSSWFNVIFKQSYAQPDTPTGDSPEGWSDGPDASNDPPWWYSVGLMDDSNHLIGVWTDPVQIVGAFTQAQYSVDGASWHDVYNEGVDLYIRVNTGSGWSSGVRFIGEDGQNGEPGDDAVAYWLVVPTAAVVKSATGALTPATLAIGSMAQSGLNTPVAYAGRFKIYEDSTLKYTSSSDESSKTYTPSSSAFSTIKVELYRSGGTTSILDWEIVPQVGDGTAVVGTLNNDTQSIPCAADGSNGNYTGAVTEMYVYIGGTDDSANWTFSASPSSGVSGTSSGSPANRIYTVTGMSVDAGYVDIMASRSGYASVTKRFSLSKAKAGAAGQNGSNGSNGTNAPPLEIEFSSDNANWHYPATTGDCWFRTSSDGGVTWTSGVYFVGPQGPKGDPGSAGGDATLPDYTNDGSTSVGVHKPAGAGSGYSVNCRIGSGAWMGFAYEFPFTLVMSSKSQTFDCIASDTGCTPSDMDTESWNSLFL